MSEDKFKSGYTLNFVLEGEKISLPVGSAFYSSTAEEPHFVAKSCTCLSSVVFPLSQLVAAVEERGFSVGLKKDK